MSATPQTAYALGFVAAIVLLLISVVIANIIPYESGVNPRDPFKRKLFFWICAVIAPIVVYVVGQVLGASLHGTKLDKFMNATYISMTVSFLLYLVVGFGLSKAMKHSKLGSWF